MTTFVWQIAGVVVTGIWAAVCFAAWQKIGDLRRERRFARRWREETQRSTHKLTVLPTWDPQPGYDPDEVRQ